MEIERRLVAPCPPEEVFPYVDDLAVYPTWMRLAHDVAVVDTYLNVRNSYGPELDRLRASRLPDGITREMAVTATVAGLDAGTRSLWLMPGVPDSDWQALGLTRLHGGVVDALVRGVPDLRATALDAPLVAAFGGGPELHGHAARRRRLVGGLRLLRHGRRAARRAPRRPRGPRGSPRPAPGSRPRQPVAAARGAAGSLSFGPGGPGLRSSALLKGLPRSRQGMSLGSQTLNVNS